MSYEDIRLFFEHGGQERGFESTLFGQSGDRLAGELVQPSQAGLEGSILLGGVLENRCGLGVVVNVTSSVPLTRMPLAAAYTASKMAIEGFTGSLAFELEAFNVQVKLVEPGWQDISCGLVREQYPRAFGCTFIEAPTFGFCPCLVPAAPG